MTTLDDNSISLKTENNNICAVESFDHAAQQAAWMTPMGSKLNIHIEYSSAIKDKLIEKKSFVSCGKVTDAQY